MPEETAFETAFRERIRAWHAKFGRHDLPWQNPRTPYRVWVSEIMLQQTRVETVVGYYERFMARFPDVEDLAAADQDEVLACWSGLGYYARGRNLHRAAQTIRDHHGGALPSTIEELMALPGVGRSTAGAIRSLGHDKPAAILDGNVKRVLARVFREAGWPGRSAVARRLWEHAERLIDPDAPATMNQGLMDLGARICTPRQPVCSECPIASLCGGRAEGDVSRYPGSRPPRQRPVRAVELLVLYDPARGVLMERRPDQGVWGGLWALPERPDDSALDETLRGLALHAVSPAWTHTAFRHAFTHFELEARPLEAEVRGPGPGEGWGWFPVKPDATLALPAPIRKWLNAWTPGRDNGPDLAFSREPKGE